MIADYADAVRREAAGQLHPESGDRTPTEIKPQLDTTYWRLMTESVSALIPKDVKAEQLPENLLFEERLAWALNYGIIKDSPQMAWAVDKLRAVYNTVAPHPEYKCVYVTNTVNSAYRTIRKIDTIKKMNEEIQRISKAIADAPGEREEYIRQRDQVIDSSAKSPSDADKLKTLYKQLDSDSETFKLMEKKQREGGFSGQEERQRYISLNQAREDRKAKVDKLLELFREHSGEIKGSDAKAEEALVTLIQLRDEKRQKEKDIETERSAVRNISILDVKAGLEEEVGKYKGNGRLTSKLGKSMQISLPLEERDIVTPEKAYEALAKIEEYDPNLFNNRSVKRKGKPDIFLVPGIGEGIYDWEGNRLLIPIMYTRSIVASMASAVVLYRVDVDQSYNDRELILSYKNDIKENKKVRSMIKLRQQLIKDYLLWIMKESQGFPLMEKQNREWFEYRIAPNKYDPKYPKDMRNLTLKQQREGLEAELKKPDTAEVVFRQALFYLLMEGENQEMISKEVLPRIDRAMQMDPNNLDLLYSAGAIYRKAKSKKCIELLVDYTKKAPQSWWSKKALELVTTFK